MRRTPSTASPDWSAGCAQAASARPSQLGDRPRPRSHRIRRIGSPAETTNTERTRLDLPDPNARHAHQLPSGISTVTFFSVGRAPTLATCRARAGADGPRRDARAQHRPVSDSVSAPPAATFPRSTASRERGAGTEVDHVVASAMISGRARRRPPYCLVAGSRQAGEQLGESRACRPTDGSSSTYSVAVSVPPRRVASWMRCARRGERANLRSSAR